MKKQITTSIVLVAIAVATPVAAQDTAPPPAPEQVQAQTTTPAAPAPAPPINMNDMRRHIYVMEGALAQAVDFGAKQLNREILSVMPGVFLLEGEARARGVHLENYGVFFDVRVPMMRQSMAFSLQVLLNQSDAENQRAIEDIRNYMKGITDPATKASLDKAVRQLERSQSPYSAANQRAIEDRRRYMDGITDPSTRASLLKAVQQLERSQSPYSASSQNPPMTPSMVTPNTTATPTGAGYASGMAAPRPAPLPRADSLWAKDPSRAYTEAVTSALVDAMVDYSMPMNIPAEQWLTVAARDDEGRNGLSQQDPLEEIVTMIYRIKGSDLLAFRTGQITRDEVRKRVQVTQF